VRKLRLIALLSAMEIISIQPAVLFIPHVYASAASVKASPSKTKKKPRKARKQMVLKGRHGKHKGRPA
jgi:hypothetical protein